jgi:hypothetical protein
VRNAQGQVLGRIPAAGGQPARDSMPIVDGSGRIVGIPYIGARRIIGDPNPDAFWSVANEFGVGRSLSFRVQVDGVRGFDVFNFDRRVLETPAFGSSPDYALELTGQAPVGYFQARRSIFEEYIEDGSFVKLREVSVSYTLPTSLVRRVRAGSATVTLAGRNLRTWTDYRGWDPETNAGAQRTLVRGFSFGTTPIPRNVTLGVTLSL